MNRDKAKEWLPVIQAFAKGYNVYRRDMHGNLQPVRQLDMKLNPYDYITTLKTYRLYEKASEVPIDTMVRSLRFVKVARAVDTPDGVIITLDEEGVKTKVDPVDMLLSYRDDKDEIMGVKS